MAVPCIESRCAAKRGERGGETQTDLARVARDSVTQHEGHDWLFSGDESIWPFWAVERLSHEDLAKRRQAEGGAQLRFNCELRKEKYLANVLGKLNDKVTNLVIEVHVPIMYNFVDLKPQETLLLEVGRKIAKRPAPETWAHSAKKQVLNKKTPSATKGQPKASDQI